MTVFGGDSHDDPGWRPVLRHLGWVLIPGVAFAFQWWWRRPSRDGLTALRTVFASFVVAFGHIAVVVFTLDATIRLRRHPLNGLYAAAAVVVLGVYGLTVPRLVERRTRIDCTDDAKLAGAYVARFFLRAAFSNTAGLVGFVGFMLTNNPAEYLLGLAFTLIGLTRTAPTARNLAADQRALSAEGCHRSLLHALVTTPPSSKR